MFSVILYTVPVHLYHTKFEFSDSVAVSEMVTKAEVRKVAGSVGTWHKGQEAVKRGCA